ncbi:MaoC/PaaZ C-terminal domain-containing protein [Enemella sp. A6]|uniref:MaoC/PaaZ C-terminal domain-containing protein n=1 Tax=Enemella sp. A6 TaxID=3440152 RepID=UPI003EB7E25A
MPIDPKVALEAEPTTAEIAWTRRDVLLYNLSVGAGNRGEDDLDYVYEKNLKVLPTFAMVAGGGISAGEDRGGGTSGLDRPGLDIDLYKVLHGGQTVTVHQPIPASGTASVATRVSNIYDKGKAAVIEMEAAATDADGAPLWTNVMQIFVRGEGGFGGDPGPQSTWSAPEREPDHVLTSATDERQAMLYRLNGDLNPLHVDPAFASMAGFEKPILHGLASYGTVARTLVDEVLDGDPTRLESLTVRFAGSIYPGQTIETKVWREGDELLLASTCPERDDAPVLTHAVAKVRA